MVFLTLILSIAAVAFLSSRLHNTLLSPWGIYSLAWLGMFALYALDWVSFVPIRIETWTVLIGSLITYGLGASIALVSWNRKRQTTMPAPDTWFEGVDLAMYGRVQFVVTVLGLIGAAGYFGVIDRLFGLQTLLTNPGSIRSSQNSEDYISAFFWWKFLFYMNWFAIPLGTARLLYQGRRTPLWVPLTLLLSIAINLTLVARLQILFILFSILFMVGAAYQKKLRVWEPVLIGTVLVVVAVYFVAAGELLGKTYDYIIGLAGFYGPEAFRPLTGIYIYITANIPAFQAYMYFNELHHTYGLFQIIPAAKLLSRLQLISVALPSEVGEFVPVPFPFNTFTYLNVFYKDWGVIGAITGPFLFGLLGNWLYLRACASGRVWHIIGAMLVAHACVLSISTNDLIRTPQWEYVIGLIVLAVISRKRSPRQVIVPAWQRSPTGTPTLEP